METLNLFKDRLSKTGEFVITIEYTVPDVADEWEKDLAVLAEFVKEDSRVSALALTDRVPTLTTHDTIDLARIGRDLSGKMPLAHISGKNRNQNTLRELLQRMTDNKLENALFLTGDKPRSELPDSTVLCPEGFLDSVQALDFAKTTSPDIFRCGAVSSFKYSPPSLMMQMMKMQKKIAHGGQVIFNQVGLDMRKVHELIHFTQANHITIPVIQALYWPTAMLAKLAIADELPGVVATTEVQKFLESFASDPDKGKNRRIKILAMQIALCRAWNFTGVHIGGLKTPATLKAVLDLADELKSCSAEDLWPEWRELWKDSNGKSVQVVPKNGFYYFQQDENGLNKPFRSSLPSPQGKSIRYRLMHGIHALFFEDAVREGRFFWKLYKWIDKDAVLRKLLYRFERGVKYPMTQCQGCGSCSLPETAYICTESACAKKLPCGPCGGSKLQEDECEVISGKTCAWVKIWNQAHHAGVMDEITRNFVPAKNPAIKHTCSWINLAMNRDHRNLTPKVS